MNAFFSSPLALAALAAIPALVAIYLLRNRFRIHHVSSLMLWEDQRDAHQGGLNLNRIQTPLLFLLELLALLALVLAAADPMIRSSKDTMAFVVILDDSFSMLANDGTTPRERAIERITRLLSESGNFQATFIVAGATPRLIGEPIKSTSRIPEVLENWKCLAPAADLEASIALGSQLAGETARVLVVTDHEPTAPLSQGRIEWWAFGRPLANLAFVNASRTSFDGKGRYFLAIANLSDEPAKTSLTVESLDDLQEIMEKQIDIEPHQIYTTSFDRETGSSGVRARLQHDSLDIDNEVMLVAESPIPLRVQVNVENEELRSDVKRALEAIRQISFTSVEPQLMITDASQTVPFGIDLWALQIIPGSDPSAYLGPFIVDRSHPLTEGLALDGVIWGAGRNDEFTGTPVVAAGNIPLLTDRETSAGSHLVTINLNPDFSTLLHSPNWPILMYNLVQWRKSFLPGLSESNIPLGASTFFTRALGEKELLVIDPDNDVRDMSLLEGIIPLKPDMPGLYRLKTEKAQFLLSVNAVSKSESDLTKTDTGAWGGWQQARLYWWEYRPIDWILLLIALILLTIHRYITATYQKGVTV